MSVRELMREAGAVAELATRSRLDDYYRWLEADSEITVCLNLRAAERLQRETLHGGNFLAQSEVQGVLLGSREREAGRTVVFIDDFKPVPGGHAAFGGVLEGLARRQTPSVVGYYRSHNREGLFLAADDLRLIQSHFQDPNSVFLLIKPLANNACTAGFFFWKDGRVRTEFTDSEVPLIPVSAAAGDGSVSWKDAAGDVPVGAVENEPEPRRDRRPLIAGLVLAMAGALGFAVLRQGGGTGAVRSAIPPVLRTVPAVVSKDAPLETGTPPEPQKRVAAVASAPQKAPPQPGVMAPAAAAPHEDTKPAAVVEKAPAAEMAVVPAERLVETAAAIHAAAPPAPAPVVENPVRPAVELPQAEAIQRIAPPVAAPAAPATASLEARTFTAPRVIHQVTPAVPRGVGPMITGDVQVDVAVGIDAFGKVTSCRVAGTRGAAAGLLTIEALKAAQLFRFQPAQENSRDVPGSLVLTFRFASTTHK
ncbi:MAG: hypothetical protein M3N54_14550 [Acidobacteriota bacterium]|nr:hypothetical protein [Acidobacteriota bacterium]